MIVANTSSAHPLPLEGGGWNATDLARSSPSALRNQTGELSPMAFPVGVTLPRAAQTPPPGAPRSLGFADESADRLAQAKPSDGAPPSPLEGEARAFLEVTP
jgi:hypothetical protein